MKGIVRVYIRVLSDPGTWASIAVLVIGLFATLVFAQAVGADAALVAFMGGLIVSDVIDSAQDRFGRAEA